MLEALASMKATGKVSIDQLIYDEIEHFQGNSLVIIITPSGTEQVVTAVRQLKNRGNSVVAILLDSTSFGSTISSINTVRSLSSTGAQVYTVRKGDDLARALDSRVSFPHRIYI